MFQMLTPTPLSPAICLETCIISLLVGLFTPCFINHSFELFQIVSFMGIFPESVAVSATCVPTLLPTSAPTCQAFLPSHHLEAAGTTTCVNRAISKTASTPP